MAVSNRVAFNLPLMEQRKYNELSEQSKIILNHRYYLKDINSNPVENEDGLFDRVAWALAKVDSQYGALPVEVELTAKDFYLMMRNLYFLPNSPTLMNAGTAQGTMSACFVLPLNDSMQDIMKTATDMAMVQKFGGGTGFALSQLRPKGSHIKTTHGAACGPVQVLKTLSSVSSMITQGGKRDGANMAVMDIRHPDILEFIRCKSVEGDIHNFNISVGVDSNWMKAVENDMEYDLVDPSTNQVTGQLNAREVFNEIVQGAWRNGEPGMIFLDRVNEDNHVAEQFGNMIATNPCGEQPLLPNESCNLGSINLARFYKKNLLDMSWAEQINWAKLEKITKTATHFLDNVIDANEYATEDIETMTKATRKIGLGVMGFSDLLIQLKVSYDSEEAREIGSGLMKKITQWTNEKSIELANQRGEFPSWIPTTFVDENEEPIHYRNHCKMTVAPTGTISMIADCASGIEPTFALAWKKQNILEGKTLHYVNKYLEQEPFYSEALLEHLSSGGTLSDADEAFNIPEWAKEVYITAPEIAPDDHVLMQAAFQEHVDAGISKTINFDNSATPADVEQAYFLAWKSNCKGITVYRAGSREKEVLVKGNTQQETEPCCDTPQIVQDSGCETCKSCGWSACAIA